MNLEKINKPKEKKEDIFATGIDVLNTRVIDNLDEFDRKYIFSNKDLFKRFNFAENKEKAKEIIETEKIYGDRAREEAKRMYDFVKGLKEVYK